MKIYVFFRFWSKNFGNLEFIGKKNKKYSIYNLYYFLNKI